LVKAYWAATEDWKVAGLAAPGADLWDHILQNDMKAFADAIESGDTDRIFDYLASIGRSYSWFGGLTLGVDGYTPAYWTAERVALLYWEKLICLAESCGVLNIENPESGPYQENIRRDADQLVARLESHFKISLTPPDDILPTFGFVVRSRIFHYRHINAIYAAAKIADLVPENGRVAEIGGGLGLGALYARRFKPLDYTIYDLPVSCVVSGFFLMNALGKEKVCLFGERTTADTIKVYPYWALAQTEDESLDLAVNQDSLPEIDDVSVAFLLGHVNRTVKRNFLSLNHETFGHRRVSEFIDKHIGLKRTWRSRNWVREGYVDELYVKA